MSETHVILTLPETERQGPQDALVGAGFDVTTCQTATEAVATLSQSGADCLVSVYDLPGDDGLALFEAIKSIDDGTPFVLFADVDERHKQEAFAAGIDRFVSRDGEQPLTSLVEEVTELTAPVVDLPAQRDVDDAAPSAEEIVRAIDRAPIGISIVDPSLPDTPLVYVNDAWEEITGYEEAEVLGRAPRFLAGPRTDEKALESVRSAQRGETTTTVELQHYRRDGTPFRNELTVAPIRGDENRTLSVSFHHDVTTRRRAQELAEQRAKKLIEEKRALRRVLGRVNGLLNELTRVLVEERRRPVILQRICEEIADEEGYAAAWFGSPTVGGDELEIEAHAGVPRGVDRTIPLVKLPGVVRETLEEGRLRMRSANADENVELDPISLDARRFVAVPVTYDGRTYGVLGVYGEGIGALDRRDQQLFDSIGSMVASRLNALETAEILAADRVINVEVAVEDEAFPLVGIAAELDCAVEYIGLMGGDNGVYELFVNATDVDELDAVTTLPFIEAVRTVSETERSYTLAATVDSATPFMELADHGASVAGIEARPDCAHVELELPPDHDVRPVLDVLTDRYDDVDLRSRQKQDARSPTVNEFASHVDQHLTERQQATLEAAHMNGYFEWPRPTDGSEIAETMDITRQTFHQHLRAAERKLVEAYVERYSVGQLNGVGAGLARDSH